MLVLMPGSPIKAGRSALPLSNFCREAIKVYGGLGGLQGLVGWRAGGLKGWRLAGWRSGGLAGWGLQGLRLAATFSHRLNRRVADAITMRKLPKLCRKIERKSPQCSFQVPICEWTI